MPDVAFATVHDHHPWLWQTPGATGDWLGWRYRIRREAFGADWLVVFDDLAAPLETDLPRDRRVLMITEPAGIKTYHPGFMNQFGVLLSPLPMKRHCGLHVATDVGLPWFFGVDMGGMRKGAPTRWTFEELEMLPPGDKRHALSGVISTKAILPRHRRRVAFVRALAERMGDRFRLYGRGFEEVDDKADAVLPYSHHLVIENNVDDGSFTEKLTDAYLGWSLPIFSGCTNIEHYFPAEAMIRFDLDASDAVERVIAAFEAPIDAARMAAIAEARRLVLHRANIFARLTDVLGRLPPPTSDGRWAMGDGRPMVVHRNDDCRSIFKRLRTGLTTWAKGGPARRGVAHIDDSR